MKKTIKKISDNTNYRLKVYLEQDYDNVGLYTPTDGDIGHIDVLCNFVVQTNENDTTVKLRDSVNDDRYKFMKSLSYNVGWGDIYWVWNEEDSDNEDPSTLGDEWTIGEGLPVVSERYEEGDKYYDLLTNRAYHWHSETEDVFSVNGLLHLFNYPVESEDIITNGSYDITLTIDTPWGRNKQVKKVTVPSNIDITFDVNATTPESLGYDYEMLSYVNTSGVIICDGGVSRLNELRRYGANGLQATITEVEGKSGIDGISQITSGLSTTNMVYVYFIDGIKYMDDEETGYTTISVYPSLFTDGQNEGFTHELLSMDTGPVVHQEVFHGITNEIEIQSDIFIERGKQAPFEFYYKMGEVSNMKELEQNGNKFFKINDSDDIRD